MKIGVLGNCQTDGFAASVRALTDAEVVEYTVQKARIANPAELEKAAVMLSECDAVFTQPSITANFGPISFESLKIRCKKLIPFPHIATSVLQPDCHYVRDNGVSLEGPMGPYHSAIIAGAFLEGLSTKRTTKLFNRYVYVSLGHCSIRADQQPMAVDAEIMGYDFEDFLKGERGVFMHTPNHPTAEILFETARQAIRKANIQHKECSVPEDKLKRLGVWPIYPDIANFHGITGDLTFRQRESRGGVFSLPEVVTAFFDTYENSPPTDTRQIEAVRKFINSELK